MIRPIARVVYEADRAAADAGTTAPSYWNGVDATSPAWDELPQAIRELVCEDVESVLRGEHHPDPVTTAIVRAMAADEYDAADDFG